VDYIADLWRSADEDLRSAAKETVLSFGTNLTFQDLIILRFISQFYALSFCLYAGKKGYQAFQKMDQL